jgi:dipeptidyl aminopeptidase/acylaminoacyl peptidase
VLVGFDRKVRVGPQFVEGLKATDLRQVPFFDYADDILIVHGTADDVVPMQDSAQFADDNVIEFVPIEGADHRFRDPKKMDAAIALIIGFFGL